MGQGNPVALKRTIESFKEACNQIVFGDMLVFDTDRDIINGYQKEYNLLIKKLPFDYIYNYGFSSCLNYLSSFAENDIVLYMNVGEVIDGEQRILGLLEHFKAENYNCFAFDNKTDPHTWYRMYNRKEMEWSGILHEELTGSPRPCPYYLFTMADTEKDNDDEFAEKVYMDIKEIVYFSLYARLSENHDLLGASNAGWLSFCDNNHDSFIERLQQKNNRYEYFKRGNMNGYLIQCTQDFQTEPHTA